MSERRARKRGASELRRTIKRAIQEGRSGRAGSAELGETIQRAIAAQMVRKFRERPEVARKLVEAGLIDEDYANVDPATIEDPVRFLREFGSALAERVREQPSTLARLDLNAVELMGQDSIGTTQAVAESTRDDRVVLFTDLEGFTSFTEDEGDTAATELLTGHYQVVQGVVRSRGGEVVKRLGDGHLLAFRAPEAAVMAGLEIVELAPDPLRLRAGAHAGEVMVSSDDLLGHVVNIASRVAGSAGGGQALITGAVRRDAAELAGIEYVSTPPRPLRGLDEPMALWEVHRVPR